MQGGGAVGDKLGYNPCIPLHTPTTFGCITYITHLLLELHPVGDGDFRKLTSPRAAGLEKPCMARFKRETLTVGLCCPYKVKAPDLFLWRFV